LPGNGAFVYVKTLITAIIHDKCTASNLHPSRACAQAQCDITAKGKAAMHYKVTLVAGITIKNGLRL